MELQALTFLIVGLTFAIYIGIAFWARASSTDEFYVAGGEIHPIANGMATARETRIETRRALAAHYCIGTSLRRRIWDIPISVCRPPPTPPLWKRSRGR